MRGEEEIGIGIDTCFPSTLTPTFSFGFLIMVCVEIGVETCVE